MTQIIVGEPTTAERLAESLEPGARATIWASGAPSEGEPGDSSRPLARDMARFEADALGQKPASIVLADDSDAALAAALVATKLLIPLAAAEGARGRSSVNGRLIAMLADAYTQRS